MGTQDEEPDRPGALTDAAIRDADGPEPPGGDADFIVTKEYRRFTEFADAVRRERYIGLCHTSPRAVTGPTGTPCSTPRPSA